MSQMQIKFIQAGFEEIIASGAVAGVVDEAAQSIKAQADANVQTTPYAQKSDPHVVSSRVAKAYGKSRAIANVSTNGAACSSAEAVYKTLSSAVM